MIKIESKYFNKLLIRHKQDIAQLGRLEDPLDPKHSSLFQRVSKQSKILALMYADFKCERCKRKTKLTRHHLIRRYAKRIMNFAKYCAVRHYWFNQVILCVKCHIKEDNGNEEEMLVISQKTIDEVKKLMEKE